MARLRFRIVLCLLLGLITTLAISWISAIVLGHPSTATVTFGRNVQYFMPPSGDRIWIFTVTRSAFVTERLAMCQLQQQGRTLVVPDESRRAGPSSVPAWSIMRRTPTRPGSATTVTLSSEIGYGWPLPAFWQQFDLSGAKPVLAGGATVPAWLAARGAPRSVPLLPAFAFICVDTLALAAGWFIALFGFGTARGIRRARLGLCRVCAYDLKGAGQRRCPECGATPR